MVHEKTLSTHSGSSSICPRCKDEEAAEKEKQTKTDDIGVDSLTIHGLPRAMNSSSWFWRLFWLFLFLSGFFIFIYFGRNRVYAYFHHDVLQSVRMISESEADFPSVTICNMRKLEPPVLNTSYTGTLTNPFEVLEKHFHLHASVHRATADFDEFSPGYSKIVNATPMFCRFGNDFSPCDKSLFKTVDIVPGCITFNPDGKAKQKEAGYEHGLQLLLYLNTTISKAEIHEPDESTMFPGLGADDFVVVIHEPNTFPNLASKYAIKSIGHHTKLALHKRYTKRMPPPFPSKCVNEMKGKRYNMFPGEYDHALCIRSCELYHTYLNCGDIPEYFRRIFNYQNLPKFSNHSKDTERCLEESMIKYNRNSETPESCNCHFECNGVAFDFTLSTTQWPMPETIDTMAAFLSKRLNKNIEGFEMEKNFAYLTIFYDDLYFIEESEVPKYDLDGLLSDIGGQAGLYLGASFFSIIELCLCITFYLVARLNKLFSKQKQKTDQENEDCEKEVMKCLT